MSANLDLVRSIYAAWERGDFSRADWAHPEIEYSVIDGPTPGGGRGLASMATAMGDYITPWKGYRVQVDELKPLDADRVLVLLRQHGRGRVSGMELSGVGTRSANVMEIRDGRVVKLVIYWDRERALADLGLNKRAVPEESTSPDPVELARRFFAAVNRRDVDAIENFYAPDAVLRGAEIGRLAGPAAIRGFFEDVLSRYDEFHGGLEEIIDLGNGVGFLVTICKGRPVGSDEEVRLRLASVLVGTESVIEQQTNYIDIDEARAAAERLAASRE